MDYIGCNSNRRNHFFFTAGKAFNIARNADVPLSIDCIRYFAGWADKLSGKVLEVDSSLTVIVDLV